MRISSGIDWSAETYEEVLRRHRFVVPPRLNVGVAACDARADGSGRTAELRSEDADQRFGA